MRARGRARSLSIPPKSKKDPPLTLHQLIRHDDLCAEALVDKVYFWSTIRKTGNYVPSRGLPQEDLADIIRDHVVKHTDTDKATELILEVGAIAKYLVKLEPHEIRYFRDQLKLYVAIYRNDCPFEVTTTNRYDILTNEASITARRFISKGDVIKYLSGTKVMIPVGEVETIDDACLVKSITLSARKGDSCLFLGPARFANHDCESNARLDYNANTMRIIARKDIEPGQEITVYYGGGFFGDDNMECLCATCEKLLRGGWDSKRIREDEEEEEEEEELADEPIVESIEGRTRSGHLRMGDVQSALKTEPTPKDRGRSKSRARGESMLAEYILTPRHDRKQGLQELETPDFRRYYPFSAQRKEDPDFDHSMAPDTPTRATKRSRSAETPGMTDPPNKRRRFQPGSDSVKKHCEVKEAGTPIQGKDNGSGLSCPYQLRNRVRRTSLPVPHGSGYELRSGSKAKKSRPPNSSSYELRSRTKIEPTLAKQTTIEQTVENPVTPIKDEPAHLKKGQIFSANGKRRMAKEAVRVRPASLDLFDVPDSDEEQDRIQKRRECSRTRSRSRKAEFRAPSRGRSIAPAIPPLVGRLGLPGQESSSSGSDTDLVDVFSPLESPSTRASSPDDDDDFPIPMTPKLNHQQLMHKRLQELEATETTARERPSPKLEYMTRIMTRSRRENLETIYMIHRRDEMGRHWTPEMGFPWNKGKDITKDVSEFHLRTPKSEPIPKTPTKKSKGQSIGEKELRGLTPDGNRHDRSVNRMKEPIKPSAKMLVAPVSTAEVKVDGSRFPGDHQTSEKLLITRWHRWADCRTCEKDFLLDDTVTRKECPRCERHSKLYGYSWPKTDKEDRFDKEERSGKLPESKLFVPKKEDTATARRVRREMILKSREELAEKKMALQQGNWNEARMRMTSGRRGRSQSRTRTLTPERNAKAAEKRGRRGRGRGRGRRRDGDSDTEMRDDEDNRSIVSAQSAFHGSEWASPRSTANSTPKQGATRRSSGMASV
ncbi:histone-lysine n-methyltransferase set9 [Venturia nashicola]|uniref:Histone-lysine N-methyltransferase SET9 n=1 Tax=Venturia nashicola TaxID=86259 RepID=A0A4Z1P3T5_9PEZI|nr:histone-lysine n-methyltransferase set9 [Venturia nashicola]TLD20822.1 histone-lysine n-methyltransferase set9 [Venturia nashicola]